MILPLEKQVCSFDQAALIYSRGYRCESTLFQWCQNKETGENKLFLTEISPPSYDWVYVFPAYTVAELGVLLANFMISSSCYLGKWTTTVEFQTKKLSWDMNCLHSDTEAKSRAEALNWLLKNNFVKVEDLNDTIF